jgi:nitrite reductase/ring-hydroxylating ferredoxin subunit
VAGIAGLLRGLFVGREDGVRARARSRWRTSSGGKASLQREKSLFSDGFTEILASDELPEGDVVEVFVDGDPVAVCRVDGVVHAVSGVCPHAQGPLADGSLDGAVLTCPAHGWGFDVRTGHCLVDPTNPVPVYKAVEREGRIAVGAVVPAGRTDGPQG